MINNILEIKDNILTPSEISYIFEILNNENNWEYQTFFDTPGHYFDSLKIDRDRLENYYKTITENGKYNILTTGIVIIKQDRQLDNSYHTDTSEISYVTYLNNEFTGGEFVFIDEYQKENIITPKKYLTIKIYKNVQHKVSEVTSGLRFSLYSFLNLPEKKIKTLL
jgi:predicted 2-oxoglutarate/Fe(II)-dependent dioxygenase YbiX